MYLTVSAQLADSHSSLRSLIAQIDDAIATMGPRAVLRSRMLAKLTRESEERTVSALELFIGKGLLACVSAFRCANRSCEQLVESTADEVPAECSQCGASQFEPVKEEQYRVTTDGANLVRAEAAGMETFRWPNDIKAYAGKVDAVILTIKKEEFESILKRFPAEHTVSGERDYNRLFVKVREGLTPPSASLLAWRQGRRSA